MGFTAFSLDLLLLLTVGLVPAALDERTAELVPEERVVLLTALLERVVPVLALELERTAVPVERFVLVLAALLERVAVPVLVERLVPELTELLERVELLLLLERVAVLAELERVPELTELLRVALLLERDALLLTVPPTELELEREAPEL